jgi:Uma2 family endonuclease
MIYSEPMSRPVLEEPVRHRYTVADYRRMGEAGILAHDARVELIDGEIIDMVPPGDPHAGTVDQLALAFGSALAGLAQVRVQNPLYLDEHSEPQPDIALLRPRADFYKSRRPRPADALLVVEVADTSLSYDRNDKIPLYARHGIPEAWLVDLQAKRLVRFRDPQGGVYTLVDEPDLGPPLGISALPDARLDLSTLLA